MKYYQEITLIDSTDMRFFELWNKLYTQVHLALVEHAKAIYGEDATHGDIAVSFPEYKCFEKTNSDNSTKTIAILGSKLRVFAKSKDALEKLNIREKCERLEDYLHIKSIKPVPENTSHVCVKRYRQKYNFDKVVADFAKHKGISHDKALKHCKTHKRTLKKLPFINMQSLTSEKRFTLEIEQFAVDSEKEGVFNTYGLSNSSTVPHWER